MWGAAVQRARRKMLREAGICTRCQRGETRRYALCLACRLKETRRWHRRHKGGAP